MPEQDELVVDLPDTGEEVDVEVKEAAPDETVEISEDIEDEEHVDYSKKVQRRIDKLTKKARDAERLQEAALNFAKNVQAENQALKDRVTNLDQGYVAEYGDRIAT